MSVGDNLVIAGRRNIDDFSTVIVEFLLLTSTIVTL